jgi:spermidine synthase
MVSQSSNVSGGGGLVRWFPLLVLLVFAVTLFISATLLFLVQPMVGKMVLPLLGGSPAVWNTCMVFFQAVLLAGYAYAHATTSWLGARRQSLAHLLVLVLPLLVLPIAVNPRLAPPGGVNPIPGLLILLAVTAGLPFFVISASAPLLQKWFAGTDHPSAKDPYFLYAASNLGSMLALVLYPTFVESHWKLAEQSWLWYAGYGVLAALTAVCVLLHRLMLPRPVPHPAVSEPTTPPPAAREVTALQRLHWVALAFIPSSLMLGATTYLTTDIAAIPLLWVLPLGLYLLSFILVFGKVPAVLQRLLVVLLPGLLLGLSFIMLTDITLYIGAALVLHLLLVFVASMVFHGELARRRPSTRHLTEFYLWMSVGGVLGGLFNALLAPVAFRTLLEYPLAMAAAALLLPSSASPGSSVPRWRTRLLDLGLPVFLGILAATLLQGWTPIQSGLRHLHLVNAMTPSEVPDSDWPARLAGWMHTSPACLFKLLGYGIPLALSYLCVVRPVRFGLCFSAVVLAGACWNTDSQSTLFRDRSFFGVLRVYQENGYHRLVHGSTQHGMQCWAPDRRNEPMTYYYRTGPIGQLFDSLNKAGRKPKTAIVGLGVGGMAVYGQPSQQFTFYEIDKAVYDIAANPDYFTYLSDAEARGVQIKVVLGDGRLQLKAASAAPEDRYEMIIMDAFTSDAIPMHLVTREALLDYRAKLADGGLVVFHISNRYLDLQPVLGNLAVDVGWHCLVRDDRYRTDGKEEERGQAATVWVVMAEKEEDLSVLQDDISRQDGDGKRWKQPRTDPGVGVWCDDYSNLLKVFNWKN